jgi:hypothetical protein
MASVVTSSRASVEDVATSAAATPMAVVASASAVVAAALVAPPGAVAVLRPHKCLGQDWHADE